VVLSESAAQVFREPLKQDVIDNHRLPLPHPLERSAPYVKLIDCLNITEQKYKKLLNTFGDTHDGPLAPGTILY